RASSSSIFYCVAARLRPTRRTMRHSSPCWVLCRRARSRLHRADLLDSGLAKHIADDIDRVPHFVGTDGADASDAEGLDRGQLARIEDEALVPNARVEILEVVSG